MTSEQIDARLLAAADEKFREFNARIVNSKLEMIGVRTPVLRALAKEIAACPGDFFDSYRPENYEQILLYALALALSKAPYADKLPYFERIIKKFDNWAHVDMTVAAFKQLKKNREDFLRRYDRFCEGTEIERRIMAVFLMDYCFDEAPGEVFDRYERIQCGEYYADMGVAWGISVALVKNYDAAFEELKSGRFSPFVVKKSVSKACDSFRVSAERKAELKNFLKKGY